MPIKSQFYNEVLNTINDYNDTSWRVKSWKVQEVTIIREALLISFPNENSKRVAHSNRDLDLTSTDNLEFWNQVYQAMKKIDALWFNSILGSNLYERLQKIIMAHNYWVFIMGCVQETSQDNIALRRAIEEKDRRIRQLEDELTSLRNHPEINQQNIQSEIQELKNTIATKDSLIETLTAELARVSKNPNMGSSNNANNQQRPTYGASDTG